MMANFTEVMNSARFSWQCNYTIATVRWRLTQLHRLHQLLLDSRDDLVMLLSNGQNTTTEVCERELAMVIKELNGHVSQITSSKPNKKPVVTPQGETRVSYLPIGVNIIISESGNRFRSLLLPLVASIAAGNITIIAIIAGNDKEFIGLLSSIWNKYLDQDCNFFVSDFQLSELDPNKADHISIYGRSSEPYSSILSSNKARFYSTAPGHNFALITEGKKQWREIAANMAQSCDNAQTFSSDRLHAIFVRKEDHVELSRRLVEYGTTAVFVDAAKHEHTDFDLTFHLKAAKEACTVIVIGVNSIGRALDIMIASSRPIQQLALLGPEASKIASFVEPWLDVKVLSVGFISPIPAFGNDAGPIYPSSNMLVSPTTFSRKVLKTTAKGISLPKTVPEIRATYQNLIEPLKPEHDGKRIGFFTQVEYLVKGVGITAGLLSTAGAFYLARWALQRVR